jgi:predicted kinase
VTAEKQAPPLIVFVTGPPAAGKSTFARQLAPRLRLPLVCKDDLKESIADSLEVTDHEWSKRIGSATWDLLFVLLERFVSAGASAIFESNFYPELQRERLLQLQREHPYVPFEVHCTADVETLVRRDAERERHPIHHPFPMSAAKGNTALELDGNVVRLDTSSAHPVDLDSIVSDVVSDIRGVWDGF